MKVIKKLIKYIFVPTFLLGLWFCLTIIFNSFGSFSIITYPQNDKTDTIQTNFSELHRGDRVLGSFVSKENNLGIISVRFNTFARINSDVLRFSIKESGQNKWYYENSYKVDQFQPDDLFTFGLPVINDSKGKKYEFQLLSLKGSSGDAVAISPIKPIFVMKHQFTKSELFANKKPIVLHIFRKFTNSFITTEFKVSSFIYFLPFAVYALTVIKKQKASVVLVLAGIAGDILFINHFTSFLTTIVLLFSWTFVIYSIKWGSRVNFFFAFLFLIFYPFFLFFDLKDSADSIIYWIYYFLLIGAFMEVISWYKKPKFLKV